MSKILIDRELIEELATIGISTTIVSKLRAILAQPAADCGLEVVGKITVTFDEGEEGAAIELVDLHCLLDEGDTEICRKSDADVRDAQRLERIAELEANIQRLTSNPADHRYWEGRWRDAYAELAALKAQEPVGEIYDLDGMHMAIWVNGTPDVGTKLYATPVAKQEAVSDAARDVMAERQRQISAEGWTPEHDNEHSDGSMALAASCYACASTGRDDSMRDWPWSQEWFKPSTPRRSLVKAAALILAEIDRLDRAAQGEKP